MNKIIKSFIWIFCLFGFQNTIFSQIPSKQRRERKKMIRECSQSKNPYIRLDRFKTLTVDEFLDYSDSIYRITKIKGVDTITNHQDKRIVVDGALLVTTQQYHDAMELESRKSGIQDYRANEMRTFFGSEDPLILFGDREITRKEYCELPEDIVAFVNFYMTDFVKRHYAPEGSKGIVYVCPRNTRSKIKYIPTIDLPANGRNYIDDFYKDLFPCFTGGNKYSYFSYINEKVKECKDKMDKNIKATVSISCVVRPNGTIDPILIEDIKTQQELTDDQTASIISTSEEIIRAMPRWEMPGGGVVYEKESRTCFDDPREYSITIPIAF